MKFAEFYVNPKRWLELQSDSRLGWIVADDGVEIGLADLEIDRRCGYVALYVQPDHRGRRVGVTILRLVEAMAKQIGLGSLVGYVDSANVASQRTMARAGYASSTALDDGSSRWEKPL